MPSKYGIPIYNRKFKPLHLNCACCKGISQFVQVQRKNRTQRYRQTSGCNWSPGHVQTTKEFIHGFATSKQALALLHSGIHVTSTWWRVLAPLHIAVFPVKIAVTILCLFPEGARRHEAIVA